jgi:hypothetical protein
LRHKLKIRTEWSKMIVANFRSGLFVFQTQRAEQDKKSIAVTVATLNGPVLSTIFEISRISIDSYGSATTTLLHTHTHTKYIHTYIHTHIHTYIHTYIQLATFCS